LSNDLEKILQRLAQATAAAAPQTDWDASVAFRWRATGRRGTANSGRSRLAAAGAARP
jgi:predicted AAA+ superfamily ATPase